MASTAPETKAVRVGRCRSTSPSGFSDDDHDDMRGGERRAVRWPSTPDGSGRRLLVWPQPVMEATLGVTNLISGPRASTFEADLLLEAVARSRPVPNQSWTRAGDDPLSSAHLTVYPLDARPQPSSTVHVCWSRMIFEDDASMRSVMSTSTDEGACSRDEHGAAAWPAGGPSRPARCFDWPTFLARDQSVDASGDVLPDGGLQVT